MSKVWHDVSEIPKAWKQFCYVKHDSVIPDGRIFVKMFMIVDYTNEHWLKYSKAYNIMMWAYSSDLINIDKENS